jgi:hypothetical protein
MFFRNDDSLVVDPWKRTVYTKQEFLLVNSLANFYGLNDHIQGETEIIVQHNKSVIGFLFNLFVISKRFVVGWF